VDEELREDRSPGSTASRRPPRTWLHRPRRQYGRRGRFGATLSSEATSGFLKSTLGVLGPPDAGALVRNPKPRQRLRRAASWPRHRRVDRVGAAGADVPVDRERSSTTDLPAKERGRVSRGTTPSPPGGVWLSTRRLPTRAGNLPSPRGRRRGGWQGSKTSRALNHAARPPLARVKNTDQVLDDAECGGSGRRATSGRQPSAPTRPTRLFSDSRGLKRFSRLQGIRPRDPGVAKIQRA
jgi:hypothetical protein